MNWKKLILLISLVLIWYLTGCTEDGIIETAVEVSPTGDGRFHPDVIDEFGCPDPDKVPRWGGIPERCEDEISED